MVNVFKLLPLGDWLWIGLATSIVGYHVVTLHNAKAEVRQEVNTEWTQKIADVNAKAKADHDALQAQVDAAASTDNAALAQKFAAIQQTLNKLKVTYAPANALPAGCRFDDERVRLANASLAK